MDVLLVYKWGYDPDDLFVRDDGTYKFVRGKLVPSDDDAAAIVSARETAAATEGRFFGATIGTGDNSWALARDVQETTSVKDYTFSFDDTLTARRIVKTIEAAGKAELVVMGDDARFAGVQGYVAAKLGIPLVASVQDFAPCPDDPTCIVAHRRTAQGTETIKVQVPALVTVAAIEAEKEVPSMKKTLAARKLPDNKIDADSLGVIEESKVVSVGCRTPEVRMAHIFEGTAAEAADSLVAALQADQVL